MTFVLKYAIFLKHKVKCGPFSCLFVESLRQLNHPGSLTRAHKRHCKLVHFVLFHLPMLFTLPLISIVVATDTIQFLNVSFVAVWLHIVRSDFIHCVTYNAFPAFMPIFLCQTSLLAYFSLVPPLFVSLFLAENIMVSNLLPILFRIYSSQIDLSARYFELLIWPQDVCMNQSNLLHYRFLSFQSRLVLCRVVSKGENVKSLHSARSERLSRTTYRFHSCLLGITFGPVALDTSTSMVAMATKKPCQAIIPLKARSDRMNNHCNHWPSQYRV